MTTDPVSITDAELTAYLDGEADQALLDRIDAALAQDARLAARLEALSVDMDVVRDALHLDRLDPPAYVPVDAFRAAAPSRLVLPMAIAAAFALGAVLMQVTRPAPTWVDTVASYQALYVTETLSGQKQDAAISEAVFQSADAALGIDLRSAVEIAGLEFRRVQMLAIEGQPLVQMAYLDEQGRPFAFCAVKLNDDEHAVLSEMSHGLAAASWVADGVGFALVGGEDVDAVTDLTSGLQRAFGA